MCEMFEIGGIIGIRINPGANSGGEMPQLPRAGRALPRLAPAVPRPVHQYQAAAEAGTSLCTKEMSGCASPSAVVA